MGQVPVGGLWRAKSNRCGGVATRTSQTSTWRRANGFLAPIYFANPVVDGESQAGGGQSLYLWFTSFRCISAVSASDAVV